MNIYVYFSLLVLVLSHLKKEIFNSFVLLYFKAVNKTLAKASLPLQLVEGYVQSITVSVPWTSLINDDSSVEIRGLEATLQPRSCGQNGPGM